MVGAQFDVAGGGRSPARMGATSGRGKRPVAGRKREVRHVTPDACRPAWRGGKPRWCSLWAPPCVSQRLAESSQLCKSVNLGVQAVEVAELGLVLGVVTLLFLRFLSCWAEDSAKVPAFRDFLSRPTFVQSF